MTSAATRTPAMRPGDDRQPGQRDARRDEYDGPGAVARARASIPSHGRPVGADPHPHHPRGPDRHRGRAPRRRACCRTRRRCRPPPVRPARRAPCRRPLTPTRHRPSPAAARSAPPRPPRAPGRPGRDTGPGRRPRHRPADGQGPGAATRPAAWRCTSTPRSAAGAGQATYLYAHARRGCSCRSSTVGRTAAMLGMIVEVWTSDDQRSCTRSPRSGAPARPRRPADARRPSSSGSRPPRARRARPARPRSWPSAVGRGRADHATRTQAAHAAAPDAA